MSMLSNAMTRQWCSQHDSKPDVIRKRCGLMHRKRDPHVPCDCFQGTDDDLDAVLASFKLADAAVSAVRVEEDCPPPSARVCASFTLLPLRVRRRTYNMLHHVKLSHRKAASRASVLRPVTIIPRFLDSQQTLHSACMMHLPTQLTAWVYPPVPLQHLGGGTRCRNIEQGALVQHCHDAEWRRIDEGFLKK